MRITAKELSFTYNKKSAFKADALKGVTLDIPEGEFFGIIGHTGSGKSTFIQHLNALLTVQSGTLTAGDIDLSKGKKTDKKLLKVLRSKVGMVFQYPEYQLFAETVFEDVAFGYKNFNPQADENCIKAAVYDALTRVGLDYSIAKKSPFELSGGQKRRVAIAGVIVTSPEVLVLDEPVAGLDPIGKRELMRLLHELHSTTCKTVIIVSHDMDEVCENCTRVAVFSQGEVIAEGTPEEVFSQGEKMRGLRLGVPLTEYLTERLAEKGVNLNSDLTENDFIRAVKELC